METNVVVDSQVNTADLDRMKEFFQSGETLDYDFRKRQLNKLRDTIREYEQQIFDALYADLKKSAEESYASEIGIVQAEISHTLKRLKKWMRPTRLKTNFLNFPSSSRMYHDPRGVVLIIGSWNYPFQLIINPLVGAIAGGNCAVLKPSESAPATSRVVAKMIKEAFDPAYVTVYQGEGSNVVPALMSAFRFDYIFYTGSGGVGRQIYQAAAKDLIPVTLELGGKSPAIVEESADIGAASRRITIGKFINAGQTCVAPDYVLAHESVFDKLISGLRDEIRNFYGEDTSESPDYGRLINNNRFQTLMKALPDEQKIVYGGRHNQDELFLSPTIVTGIGLENPLMKEEIFGPILPVLKFTDREEALKIVKKLDKPLSFYLFSKNAENESWWMRNATFGGGCINNTLWHLSNPNLPFGGVGQSGMGAYHGKYSFDTFTHKKAVLKTPTWFDPKMKYPPFSGKLKLLKRFIR